MDGDHLSSGGTRSVPLTSTRGDTVTDSNQWAGLQFEHIVYNGAGSGTAGEVSDTITLPWTSAATASQAQPSPLPTLNAYITGIAETKTFTPGLASGGTREADVTNTHDSIGRVTAESDVPDTTDASKDTCTRTTYPASTTAAILTLPYEAATVSVPCTTTPSLPHDAVSDVQTFYDGSTTLGAVPTVGNATKAQLATSYNGSTPSFTVESTATFDQYGRKLTSTDADGRTTTTAYTPATGAEPTSVQVSTPTTQNGTTATTTAMSTTTTYDPARDLPLTVTDPASYVTTETYDALGRLTAVWKAGNATTGPANIKFSYTLPPSGLPMVTTQTINGSGAYMTDETFYDSLGRVLETQNETASGNRTVSDVYYNSDGWKSLVSNPYVTGGAPSGTLVQATDADVPSQAGYVYDGVGRVVRQVTFQNASELWETDTTYGGDYTTVVPPSGGTPHTTFTEGRGLTTAIWQYHDGVTPGVTVPPSGYDKTTYSYTPARKLAGITDAASNAWSYQYDLAGNQTSATDPDTGTTASTYDPAGQLMTTTNADSQQVSYVYDADGRKIASYDTTGGAGETSADQIAAWKFDTIKKGKLTSSSTFYGGLTYTKQVTGYNGFGLPIGTVTIIPTGAPLAGNYSQTLSYFSGSEQLAGYGDGPYGGLPAETVSLGYDAANEPNSLGSPAWNYVASLSYTDLAQPQEYTMGTTATPAWLQQTYDAQNRPHTSTFQAGLTPVTLDATTYSFDNSGNLTQEADTPSGGPAQVQCFQYDYLARLDQAWSQGTSGCSAGPSQPAESGAAAPYWEQYSYDVTGNLTGITSTPASGSATTIATQFPFTSTAHAPSSQTVTPPSGGTSTTTYAYYASGGMKTATGPAKNESLTWDAAGRLKSVTVTPSGGPATTTNYLYDADGQLLMQQATGGVTTLYLPDTEITQNGTGAAATGTRYYSLGGVTVAARSSVGSVAYLDGDLHGTSTLAVDISSLAATRRYFDPYGNPAGAAPGSWIGMRAFVGGTADPGTGLTSLGLREYLPGLGEFISPDPLLVPYDPQNLNPYAYASDNPSTKSDPSGANDGSTGLDQCAGNISYCLGLYYQQNGGHLNNQGVPYPCCYHPGPGTVYSVSVPAPKPILRPVLKKFTLGLLPNSFMALVDNPGGDTQITPVGDWGISININVPGGFGPEILITPPGYTGPLDIKDPPAEHGPSILINNPPDTDWLTLTSKSEINLPAYEGGKTSGVLVRPDGSQEPLISGRNGPALGLAKPRPGMNGNIVTHVEAHAAAIMRNEGLASADLYINRMPCPGDNGCMANVSRMVPTGRTLNIFVMPEGNEGPLADWIQVTGTG
jgi:RHS repeat-associated protein